MIKIYNVKIGGVFTLPAAADVTGNWSDLDGLPSEASGLGTFTVVQNTNITVKGNDPVTNITTDTELQYHEFLPMHHMFPDLLPEVKG